MKTPHPVAFVGFEEYDNLGVGYIAAVLSENGYESEVIDFRDRKENILKELKRIKPLVVGFSVIFQNHIDDFAELIRFLRRRGIKCHFSAGGQYASLRYEELFETIPELDSIVRFDGESTFLELVNCIHKSKYWKNIPGIAYKENISIIVNPLRRIETDLDKYPLPLRSPLRQYALGKKFATILAGRGCINNCIYCYLRDYARQSSGPYKRIRSPGKVVWEMELLHYEMGCSVYLFEDDDFPVKTEGGHNWIKTFCKELKNRELTDSIMWKINCRPDEIDSESFSMMKKHGLFLVFLGIEDGTDEGLKRLNKHMTVSECLDGIHILKKLGIGFDYGFMLFQPTSTFRSVNDNLKFLREVCADGYTPVTFLKMMPYAGTIVEMELRKEGRLKGRPGFQDYNFLDGSMDYYYDFITDCFMEWLRASDGVLNIIKWARNYIAVYSRFYGFRDEILPISKKLEYIISESNRFFLDILSELATKFESEKFNSHNSVELNKYREIISLKQEIYKKQINDIILEITAHYQYLKYLQPQLYGT